MSLPRPTAVIFDMDGTTVRHLRPWLLHVLEIADDAMYRTRTGLARVGKMMGYGTLYRRRKSTRKPRLIVHRMLHKVRRKSVDEIVEPCPGIIDLLELFRARGIPVGLVSNGLGKGYGHEILEKFDLMKYFQTCVFREDIMRSKPDPEAIVTALSQLGASLTENDSVWYIGDRAKDVAAAAAATAHVRARIVPIGYGLHTALALFERQLSADHLVISYEDWYSTVEGVLTGTHAPTATVQ